MLMLLTWGRKSRQAQIYTQVKQRVGKRRKNCPLRLIEKSVGGDFLKIQFVNQIAFQIEQNTFYSTK